MDTSLQRFYEGSPITFNVGNGGTMVNATEMANPFGKQPFEWLRNKQSKNFLVALSKLRNCGLENLVQVNRGDGEFSGTWINEDVALEFARWLSPEFGIWCNDQIKEMLKRGVLTANTEQLKQVAHDKQELQTLTDTKNRINKRLRFLKLRIEENETAIYSAFRPNKPALQPENGEFQYSLF
jgi:hypothetical protein